MGACFKFLGNQPVGFLVIFELVGFDIYRGFSALKDLPVLVPLTGFMLLIDGIRLTSADDLVLHFDIVVPGVGAQNLHFHIAAGKLGLNFDREIGSVCEFEVGSAPVDGGVHTQVNIGGGEAVIDPLHNLHICQKSTVIQGRGALADAAAKGICQVLAGIGGGLLVALFLGPLPQSLVVGEGFAGLQDHSVQGFAHNAQIGIPVFVGGMGGFTRAKHIPEKKAFRLRRGDVRHGDTQGVTILAVGQKCLRVFQIKAVAIGARHDLVGIGVNSCVHGGNIQFVINGVQIQRSRFRVFRHIAHFHQEHIHAVRVQNLCVQLLNIQTEAGGSQGQHQSLAGSVFIKALRAQIGLFSFQGIAGLGELAGIFPGVLAQGLGDVVFIQLQIGEKADGVIAGEGCLIIPLLFCLGAGTAVGKSRAHGGSHIQLGACLLGGEGQGFLGELNHHVLLCKGAGCGPFYGADGLAAGHAAYVDTGDHHIVQNPVAIGVLRSAAYAEIYHQYDAEDQYGSGSAQTAEDCDAVTVHKIHDTLTDGGDLRLLLGFRLPESSRLVLRLRSAKLLVVNRGHGGGTVGGGIAGSLRVCRGNRFFGSILQIQLAQPAFQLVFGSGCFLRGKGIVNGKPGECILFPDGSLLGRGGMVGTGRREFSLPGL